MRGPSVHIWLSLEGGGSGGGVGRGGVDKIGLNGDLGSWKKRGS